MFYNKNTLTNVLVEYQNKNGRNAPRGVSVLRQDVASSPANGNFLRNTLAEIGARFNEEVYENGLRELLSSMGCPTRGQYEDVTMLTMFTCGSCLVNLVRGDRYIALTADDEPGRKMGAMELEGTINEIQEITETVIQAWNSLSPEERASAQTKGAKLSFLGL